MIKEGAQSIDAGKFFIVWGEQFVRTVLKRDGNEGVYTEGDWFPADDVRFVCDTAEEAERVRKLLEAEREEIEAVRRRYELLLDRLVNP